MVVVRSGRKKLLCEPADTLLKRLKGIMFCGRGFTPLLFFFEEEAQSKNAIHSFFCPRFTAVFVDARKRVVEVRDVEAWRLWVTPKKGFKYLVEAPPKINPFKVGDQLSWE